MSASARVSLTRGRCYGDCPAYTVTLTGAGGLRFEPSGPFWEVRILRGGRADGRDSLARTPFPADTVEARIPPEAVALLLRRIEAAGFFRMRDAYELDAPGCGAGYTDGSTRVLRVEDGARVKTVRHYIGCPRAPAALSRLESLVDSVAGVARWLPPPPIAR